MRKRDQERMVDWEKRKRKTERVRNPLDKKGGDAWRSNADGKSHFYRENSLAIHWIRSLRTAKPIRHTHTPPRTNAHMRVRVSVRRVLIKSKTCQIIKVTNTSVAIARRFKQANKQQTSTRRPRCGEQTHRIETSGKLFQAYITSPTQAISEIK